MYIDACGQSLRGRLSCCAELWLTRDARTSPESRARQAMFTAVTNTLSYTMVLSKGMWNYRFINWWTLIQSSSYRQSRVFPQSSTTDIQLLFFCKSHRRPRFTLGEGRTSPRCWICKQYMCYLLQERTWPRQNTDSKNTLTFNFNYIVIVYACQINAL